MKAPSPDFSNKAYLLPHINKEGVRFGLIACVLALVPAGALAYSLYAGMCGCVSAALGAATLLMALLAYGVFLFFRDPERFPPDDEKAILSPADGRICLIRQRELPDALGEMEEFKGRKYWCVSVFMSVFNVHVNRMPTAGTVLKKQYVPGKFFNASLDKASKDNERCNYLVKADCGSIYAVTQIAGLVARRIVPQVEEGQHLGRTERFGLIRFGSRLDVYLPEGVEPSVKIGQIMVAGETVLGRMA